MLYAAEVTHEEIGPLRVRRLWSSHRVAEVTHFFTVIPITTGRPNYYGMNVFLAFDEWQLRLHGGGGHGSAHVQSQEAYRLAAPPFIVHWHIVMLHRYGKNMIRCDGLTQELPLPLVECHLTGYFCVDSFVRMGGRTRRAGHLSCNEP
jgi:hypothetical protein